MIQVVESPHPDRIVIRTYADADKTYDFLESTMDEWHTAVLIHDLSVALLTLHKNRALEEIKRKATLKAKRDAD